MGVPLRGTLGKEDFQGAGHVGPKLILRLFYLDGVTLLLLIDNDDNIAVSGVYVRAYIPRPGAVAIFICGTCTSSTCRAH